MQSRGRRCRAEEGGRKGHTEGEGQIRWGLGTTSSLPLSPLFPSRSPDGGRSSRDGAGIADRAGVADGTESHGRAESCGAAACGGAGAEFQVLRRPLLYSSLLPFPLPHSLRRDGDWEPLAGGVGAVLLLFPREGIASLFSHPLERAVPLFPRAFYVRGVSLSEKDDFDCKATPYARRIRQQLRRV